MALQMVVEIKEIVQMTKNKISLLLISFFILTIFTSQLLTVSFAQQFGVLSITPESGDLKINEEKVVSIKINSATKVSGFDLTFSSDSPISIIGFERNLSTTPKINPFDAKKVLDKVDGKNHRISYIFTSKYTTLPETVELFMKVSGSTSGQGKINLDPSNSTLVDGAGKPLELNQLSVTYNLNTNQSSADFLAAEALPPIQHPSDSAVVTIKTKLYGATNTSKKIKAVAVAVGRIGEGKYETQFQPFDFIANDDGTFSGTFAFPDFKDGNKFSLMIRADNYLLKRICDVDPKENTLGEYRCQTPSLTIRSGEPVSFDFSGISLLPGDLGIVDGVLNGYDLSVVLNNLNKSDKEAVALADLNYDGIVDAKDMEIIQFVAANGRRKADI